MEFPQEVVFVLLILVSNLVHVLAIPFAYFKLMFFVFWGGIQDYSTGGFVDATECFDTLDCLKVSCRQSNFSYISNLPGNCGEELADYQGRLPSWASYEYSSFETQLIQTGFVVMANFLALALFPFLRKLVLCIQRITARKVLSYTIFLVIIIYQAIVCIFSVMTVGKIDPYAPAMPTWLFDIIETSTIAFRASSCLATIITCGSLTYIQSRYINEITVDIELIQHGLLKKDDENTSIDIRDDYGSVKWIID